MSLETLLEAARYLEYKSEVKARGEEPHDYYTFVRLSSVNNNSSSSSSGSSSNASNPPAQSSHANKHSPSTTASASHSSEESRERRRSGPSTSRDLQEHSGSGTREVHNKLEKNRRAHLKECFEALKRQLPNMDDRKTSNLSILRGAIRYIQTLKRKEREQEHDLERLAREKIAFQQRLAILKKDLSTQYDHIDVNSFMTVEDNETTTTASECGGGSDLDDELQSETSQKSNQNSMSASDAASSVSSSTALSSVSRSGSTAIVTAANSSVFPKQTSFSSVFPSVLKSSTTSPPKVNSSFSSEAIFPAIGKNLARVVSSDGHSLHLTNSDVGNNQQTRVISASSLQAMTGILTSPHAVQVITPPSNIKLLATQNSISSSTSSVSQVPVTHRPQGQIHVLAPSGLSYVAAPSASTVTSKSSSSETVLHAAKESVVNSKQQLMSPVTLVSSPTFVGISQVGTMTKPIVINQTANFSELMMATVPSSSLTANHVLMKPSSLSSSMFGTNMALTIKNSLQNNSGGVNATSSNSLQPSPSPHNNKQSSQILQSSPSAQNTSNLLHSEGIPVNAISRQVSLSSARPHSISNANIFAHSTSMAHLASQAPLSVSGSQLVSPTNHVSGITPLVGSVSVVSHTGAVHHQILAQSQSIGKVLASPILKSINQVNPIPIIQQQFLQAAGNLPNQQIMKPVVVVSMPNIIPSGNVQSLSTRPLHTAHDQREAALCSPSPGPQK